MELVIIADTWECVGGSCIDPGNGLGTYASLSACQSNCILETWNCVGFTCFDPGTGAGDFTSLSACQSNCSNTSVELNKINDFKIYPNPNSGIFNVSFNTLIQGKIEISIINTLGKKVFYDELENFSGDYEQQFSIQAYSKGIYFINIKTNIGVIIKKLVIQ